MRIVIDFDGTIVEDAYPNIGELKKDAKAVIRKLFAKGHSIVINTCRQGYYEGKVEEFLVIKNIPFNYINCNLPSDIEKFGCDCRKISGDVYIDDKQVGGLPSWNEIYEYILNLEHGE
jgi:uncharacterized HAD superfamily protein